MENDTSGPYSIIFQLSVPGGTPKSKVSAARPPLQIDGADGVSYRTENRMPSKPAKPASVTGPSCTAHERPDASTPVITKRPPVAESGICDPSGNETKVRADSSDMQGTLAAQILGDGGPRGAPFRSRHQR